MKKLCIAVCVLSIASTPTLIAQGPFSVFEMMAAEIEDEQARLKARAEALRAAAEAAAFPGRLATQKVYQYGGPESRTDCVDIRVISDNPITNPLTGGKTTGCFGWRTSFQQHAFFIDWYSPNVDNASAQLRSIAEDCLQEGIAVAVGAAVLSPPTVASFLTDSLGTLELGVRSCIQRTEAVANILEHDLDLRIRTSDFW